MNTANVDIIFLYEHVVRELDVACSIAYLIKQRHGLSMEVVQWPYGYHRFAKTARPKVVVLPFCYSSRSFELCLLDWRETVYFNMGWEQLFYRGNRMAKSPRGEFACKHVIHHAWSDGYAQFLIECGISREHIFVNGHPAYTLYDEPYRSCFKTRASIAETYGLDPAKKWIFFPENYNWAFYSKSTLERFISDGQSPSDVSTMREFCRSSLAEVIHWLRAASLDDRFEIIIRPRPATTLEEFESAVQELLSAKLSRAHICKEETVREWILASDMVVSSHSTSLIEASIAGKTSYMLEPYPIPSALSVEWHQRIPHLKTENDFLAACSQTTRVGTQPLETWARGAMMAHGDAILNIVDYLAALCRAKVPRPSHPSRTSAVEHRNYPLPGWLLFELLKFGSRQRRYAPMRSISPDLEKDFISQADIEQRIGRWGALLSSATG